MVKKISKLKINTGQALIISFVWLLMLAIPVLFSSSQEGVNWNHIITVWLSFISVFIIFLINRFLLIPYLFFKDRKALYFFSISAIIIGSTIVTYMKSEDPKKDRELEQIGLIHPPERARHMPPPHLHEPHRENIPLFANLFILSILLIGFDSGLLFFSKWMQSEQNKLKAEKESIKNQMDFLQTQISPHFFMNTLNNIHALVDINTEEAKEAIIKLSRLMDYMLYESRTSKVPIIQEMDFIRSYVELMKLRLTDEIDIRLDIPTFLPAFDIPPLLSISFIENAFKYGISYESPSFIHISMKPEDTRLIINVRNSMHPKKEIKKNSGIGIANARKRLDLIYGNNYKLHIDDKSNIFNVELNIPI